MSSTTPTLTTIREAVEAAKLALKAAEAKLAATELGEADKTGRTAWLSEDNHVRKVILNDRGEFVYEDTAYGDLIRRVLVVDGETVWESYGISLRLFSSEEAARVWDYRTSFDED